MLSEEIQQQPSYNLQDNLSDNFIEYGILCCITNHLTEETPQSMKPPTSRVVVGILPMKKPSCTIILYGSYCNKPVTYKTEPRYLHSYLCFYYNYNIVTS